MPVRWENWNFIKYVKHIKHSFTGMKCIEKKSLRQTGYCIEENAGIQTCCNEIVLSLLPVGLSEKIGNRYFCGDVSLGVSLKLEKSLMKES